MNPLDDVVLAWLGLLFGLTGIGAILTVAARFLRNAAGGFR